jgi:protein PsiE
MVPNSKVVTRMLSIPVVLQFILNLSLVLLAVILCIMLFKEVYHFLTLLFLHSEIAIHDLLERILVFFLYFEFIAMIVKYFQEHYHFPLRYFLYIGITAMIRLVIAQHDDPLHTLLYACVIFVLIVSYYIVNFTRIRRERL